MTPVTLKVSANVPKDCIFWPEDDSWNGVCEELSLTIRGSSQFRGCEEEHGSGTSGAYRGRPSQAFQGRSKEGRLKFVQSSGSRHNHCFAWSGRPGLCTFAC
jgi:hypothetical protein